MKQANPGEHEAFRLYRALARPITPLVYKTGLTANQITVGRVLVFAPLSMIFFYHNSYLTNLVAIIFYHMTKLFDVVDGEIARLRGKSSLAGHWLDYIMDFVCDGFILAGVTVGAVRSWSATEFPWVLVPFLSSDLLLVVGLLAIFSLSGNYLLFEQIENKFQAFSNESTILERFRDSYDASRMDRLVKSLVFAPSLFWRITVSMGYTLTVAVLLNQIIAALILISMVQLLRLFTMINVHFQVLRKDGKKDNLVVKLIRETHSPKLNHGKNLPG